MIAPLVSVALYALGFVRVRALHRPFPMQAIAAFALGSLVLAASLCDAEDALADRSLAWHMLQHLVLVGVAAPLLLLGAPLRLALAALPFAAATGLARILNSTAARMATHPVVAWLQFAGVLYGTHLSPMYEGALEHPPMHVGEHVLFLTSACVFWTPLLAVAPAPHAPAHPIRLLLLFLALPMSAFLGFFFYVTRYVMYGHYAAYPNALADQASAGTMMWVGGGLPLFVALLWCVADWGARERRLGASS